ncbi:hypothetical protein J1N35_042149 [Gossypium stocksii]|uniref:BURP domain-containing protein n=1 Tax=Gossypium stocksii TaxID=47602 RepID=A0A9D3ZK47_9ROSI|nr:hypothetical protein J1N35_042149 [Gossypium stocksii]
MANAMAEVSITGRAWIVKLGPGNAAALPMEDASGVSSNGVGVLRLPHKDSSSHMGMHMTMGMGKDDLVNSGAKVFAVLKDIEVGKRMPLYFPYVDDPTSFHFLPEHKTHHIPLSTKELPMLLRFFSFSPHSQQALTMKKTLEMCEVEPIEGEVTACVTSLSSLSDFARGVFGPDSQVRLVRSSLVSNTTPFLQNYTVVESKEISTGKIIGCHNQPYPYAVYYCHHQVGTVNKLFMVSLTGDNGDRVNAVFICHMDTSSWDEDHVSFRLLGVKPGESEICHFFPAYDLVVVP